MNGVIGIKRGQNLCLDVTGVNSPRQYAMRGAIIRREHSFPKQIPMIHRLDCRRRVVVTMLLVAGLAGCTSIPSRPVRPTKSSYGCMQAVVDEKLPAGIPDSHAHCLAAGLIARYCSVSEAYLAGAGKELKDLLGPGDAEWRDWHADRVGIACAKSAEDDSALAACCSARGY